MIIFMLIIAIVCTILLFLIYDKLCAITRIQLLIHNSLGSPRGNSNVMHYLESLYERSR